MQATQSVAPRPAITGPDGDIGTLPHYPCENASVIRLGAVCDTAGATLTCRVILLDAVGNLAAVSSAMTFTADATPLAGTQYLATPNPDAWIPVGGPSIFAIHVDAVSKGAWIITPMAS
jgi:hypothetical protein